MANGGLVPHESVSDIFHSTSIGFKVPDSHGVGDMFSVETLTHKTTYILVPGYTEYQLCVTFEKDQVCVYPKITTEKLLPWQAQAWNCTTNLAGYKEPIVSLKDGVLTIVAEKKYPGVVIEINKVYTKTEKD